MSTRPNFLFIITDQQRADHLGAYGNAIVQTPHVDSLARAGFRAERFYVATPICMPNRATLMTGRMPSVHGVRHNGIELSLEETTFVDVLREAAIAPRWSARDIFRTSRARRPSGRPTRPRARRARRAIAVADATARSSVRHGRRIPATS